MGGVSVGMGRCVGGGRGVSGGIRGGVGGGISGGVGGITSLMVLNIMLPTHMLTSTVSAPSKFSPGANNVLPRSPIRSLSFPLKFFAPIFQQSGGLGWYCSQCRNIIPQQNSLPDIHMGVSIDNQYSYHLPTHTIFQIQQHNSSLHQNHTNM